LKEGSKKLESGDRESPSAAGHECEARNSGFETLGGTRVQFADDMK
jgi:hypothetical protein